MQFSLRVTYFIMPLKGFLRFCFARSLPVAVVVWSCSLLTNTSLADDPRYGLDERPANLTCVAAERPQQDPKVGFEREFEKLTLSNPRAMVQPPGDRSRWFLAERGGQIKSFPNDSMTSEVTVVLDITSHFDFTSRVLSVDSQQWGITSIAFHPDFANNRYLFVAYNAKPSEQDPVFSFVSRFTAVTDDDTFDPASEKVLLSIQQNGPFHHVGQLAFGPDGFLYIGSGDPQSGTGSVAQDLNKLQGKILRIDVDNAEPYGIPADNPFANNNGGLPEIFAWGLRNPWRFSFDSATGELWAGDVGWRSWEEVSKIQLGGNYGWPIVEGTHCSLEAGCETRGLIEPIYEYSHADGSAIIGGYVYRGQSIPELQGVYVFGDFSRRTLWGLFFDGNGDPLRRDLVDISVRPSSFAESVDGELYVFPWMDEGIFKVVPGSAPTTPVTNVLATRLSETGCVDPSDPTIPDDGLIPYTVNTPLWSDGAGKHRWLAIPEGAKVTIQDNGDLEFPIGTVFIKTFSFQDLPVETRLFMRHSDGSWAGYSYEWNDELTDAQLLPAGKTKVIGEGITWNFPSRAQCLQCHTEAAGFTLGPEVAQLNGMHFYPSTGREVNQLATWDHIGLFEGGLPALPADLPALVRFSDDSAPLVQRARSYLHANCSNCHRPNGPAQANIDFRFSSAINEVGVCDALPQQGDLGVANAHLLIPGDPFNSIISLRMHALDVHRMPPLATSVIDEEGTSVIDDWILTPDVCQVFVDNDGDGTTDNADNCVDVANADQRDTNNDGYGNLCDGDLDNDGVVSTPDLVIFQDVLFTSDSDDADFDGDGIVSTPDLELFRRMLFKEPGPNGFVP